MGAGNCLAQGQTQADVATTRACMIQSGKGAQGLTASFGFNTLPVIADAQACVTVVFPQGHLDRRCAVVQGVTHQIVK